MRIDKVNKLIKQELGKIILENLDFEPGVLVTVLEVDTSSTLENATVYLSIFPEGKAGSVLKYLNKEIGKIQSFLNKRLALRFVPKIMFKITKSIAYVSEIDKAFKEIKQNEG